MLDPHLRCILVGEEPVERSRVKAETLGRLSQLRVTVVVLAITTNARPVVQWFSSIMTLMMDVTVSLLRLLSAAGEVRMFINDGAI